MKKYSYISLLTNDNYFYGIALLAQSLRKVKSKYPLHVLITDGVSKATRNLLDQINVTYELVDTIPITDELNKHNMSIHPGVATTWENCWTKFKIYDLTQFEKIVFLDADILVLKNLDHLFNKPHMTSCLDGEYFNLWPGWDHFNSGCIVIKPNHQEFQDILNFAINFPKEKYPNYVVADQEILNFYYNDWPSKKELHLNKYYDVFPPYVQEEQLDELKENCYFVHFVGRKPWNFWIKSPAEHYSEYYYNEGRTIIKDMLDNKINYIEASKNLVLTVYGICKNEINNIEKWLECFTEADYVCLLDTGSTDGTWEFLQQAQEKYKNLIINQKEIKPWRYDKARNESLALVPKSTNLFFMVDLDEIIKEKDWSKKIKEAWTPLFDRGCYDYHRDVDPITDTIVRTIKEYRIHTAYWNHYENIVHEALVNKIGIKQFYMETCTPINIQVWHYPDKTKQKNYIELCETDLAECPNDYIMRLQLAIEYEIEEKWEKALEHYQWLIDNKNTLQYFEQARCYSGAGKAYLAQKNKQKALTYFREGRLLFPTFTDNYLDAAQVYYNNKNFETAGDLCEAALKTCETPNWCNVHDINSYFVYYIAALSFFYQRNFIKATAYISIAQSLNPNQEITNLKKEISNQLRASWQKKSQ